MNAHVSRWLAALMLWAIVLVTAYGLTPTLAPLDDSYIALASAQSVVRGQDPHYGSPALVGVTSPAYVALLAGLLETGLAPLTALRVAGALSLTSLLASLGWLATVAGTTGWRALALVGVVVPSGFVVTHSTNGLETGFAMALICGMIASYLANRPLGVAAGAGVIPALRPDLAVVAGLILAASLWRLNWRARSMSIGMTIAVSLPFLIWLRMDTGAWIPQTMAAKAAFFAEACLPANVKLATGARNVWRFLTFAAPATFGLIALGRHRIGWLGLAGIVLTLAAYTWQFPGGLRHNALRYQYPILIPWAALGWAWLLQSRAPEMRFVAACCLVFAIGVGIVRNRAPIPLASEYVANSEWLEAHVPRDAPILVQDAGAPAVFTTHRLVDLVGLKTPSSVPVHQRVTFPTCGAGRTAAIAEIAKRSGAGYLVVTSSRDHEGDLIGALQEQGIEPQTIRAKPANLATGYTVYSLVPGSSGTSKTR
jgi:hypothetical protein